MKPFSIFACLLFMLSAGYVLFWLANKAVLLNYHPDAANDHWLLRYFLPVALVDILIPVALIVMAVRMPTRRTLLIAAGFVFIFGAIAFQELSLAERTLQLTQPAVS